MTIKKQFEKIKENWLIALLLIILIAMPFFSGGITRSMGIMQESYAMNDMAYGAPMMKSSAMYYDEGFAPEVEERKITKNSYMSLEVERNTFEQKTSELKELIKSTNSFILNENVRKNSYGDSEYYVGDYSIKVLAESYDFVITQISELGTVESISETGTDITASYENLEINLAVEKEKLRRYQELYDESDNTEDKIKLTDRIFQQERSIKYLEERINNMDTKVEYSTISLNLAEKRSDYAHIDFVDLSEVADTAVRSLSGMILLTVKVLPYAIILLIGYLIVKKRKIQKSKKAKR